jgi:hypothetical protein
MRALLSNGIRADEVTDSNLILLNTARAGGLTGLAAVASDSPAGSVVGRTFSSFDAAARQLPDARNLAEIHFPLAGEDAVRLATLPETFSRMHAFACTAG